MRTGVCSDVQGLDWAHAGDAAKMPVRIAVSRRAGERELELLARMTCTAAFCMRATGSRLWNGHSLITDKDIQLCHAAGRGKFP